MEGKESFGKYILKKRKDAGLSQKMLADQLYVTESAVSKWERGISYPDITLVASLCELLHISEHELITATDDYRQRETERQAGRFRRMVKAYSWIFYAMYGVALITCFICNLAVQHTLSWFFIVLTSIMTAFSLTNVPVLAPERRKAFYKLISFFVSLNILLLTCCIYTNGNWFFVAFAAILFAFSVVFLPLLLRGISLPGRAGSHKTLISVAVDTVLLFILVFAGLTYTGHSIDYIFKTAYPTCAFCVILPWIFVVVIRYIRFNGFYKTSACIAVTGVFTFFCNTVIGVLIERKPFIIPPFNLSQWNTDEIIGQNVMFIILASALLFALLFAIAGAIVSIRRRK